MTILQIMKQLIALGERQGQTVLLTQKYLERVLNECKATYRLNYFIAQTPQGTARLITDERLINSLPCSFVGGFINTKAQLLSSVIPSRYNLFNDNINFNPFASTISRSNFYFAPAVAIAKNDLSKILKAKKVTGEVKVKIISTKVAQIMVGNFINPVNVIFNHYDSLGPGAIDNASGVAVCLSAIKQYPDILKNNLLVFDPNEELSLDKPTYWGHGYRIFEQKYARLLKNAKKIVVIDSVGNGLADVSYDLELINLAFPLANIKNYRKKVAIISADFDHLMTVYHSNLDDLRGVKQTYLKQAEKLLIKTL